MKISNVDGNWVNGSLWVAGNKFAFSAKVFPESNKALGITDPTGDGHVSKLDVTNVRREELVIRYDRGWDTNAIPSTTPEIIDEIESERIIDAVDKNLS